MIIIMQLDMYQYLYYQLQEPVKNVSMGSCYYVVTGVPYLHNQLKKKKRRTAY